MIASKGFSASSYAQDTSNPPEVCGSINRHRRPLAKLVANAVEERRRSEQLDISIARKGPLLQGRRPDPNSQGFHEGQRIRGLGVGIAADCVGALRPMTARP